MWSFVDSALRGSFVSFTAFIISVLHRAEDSWRVRTTVFLYLATASGLVTNQGDWRCQAIPSFLLLRAMGPAATSGRLRSGCSMLRCRRPTTASGAWFGMKYLPERKPRQNLTN